MNELEKLEKAKQDIQDKIDKLKNPKFEVGKWYRYENRKAGMIKVPMDPRI